MHLSVQLAVQVLKGLAKEMDLACVMDIAEPMKHKWAFETVEKGINSMLLLIEIQLETETTEHWILLHGDGDSSNSAYIIIKDTMINGVLRVTASQLFTMFKGKMKRAVLCCANDVSGIEVHAFKRKRHS